MGSIIQEGNKRALLQSIEGYLQSMLLKLGVLDAQHIHGEGDARRQKLLKLAIKALQQLDAGNNTMDAAAKELTRAGPAMSLEPSLGEEADRAADLLSHRMGCWMPPERRGT